jgi:hypothetical protein
MRRRVHREPEGLTSHLGQETGFCGGFLQRILFFRFGQPT